ncbi:hypothetical protein [Candidatus Skiveiella danica]|jgi:hypothetical protein|uniref:hypothetical protein n=1 Tax=Candidatus Skiveiella danica TaxID=3386177 RepID=UPI0039B8ABE3
MSVTADTLSFIQQAGQSIDAARQALVEAVAQQGQLVASAVVEQPFGAGNDKLFAQWKTLARLAQEVQSIEEQFKTIYETASALKAREIQVLAALPHAPRHRPATRGDAVDEAIIKEVIVKTKGARKLPKRSNGKVSANAETSTQALAGNHATVLDFLRTQLNRKSWKPLTHATMAKGSGIPAGSVGASLARLKKDGLILTDDKGAYKLA